MSEQISASTIKRFEDWFVDVGPVVSRWADDALLSWVNGILDAFAAIEDRVWVQYELQGKPDGPTRADMRRWLEKQE